MRWEIQNVSFFCKEEGLKLIPAISAHLQDLQSKIHEYFPSINLDEYKWVRNPFVSSEDLESTSLSCQEEDDLTEIRNDGSLKRTFLKIPLLTSFGFM